MWKAILLCIILSFCSSYSLLAQGVTFQTGHTHDILEVHFSPDDSQLVSYSAGDGRLCLWEVKTGRLLWMSKTSFIRKGKESINLYEFYWSEDGKNVVTKSANGTYQTWDIQTGKIQGLSESKPDIKLIVPNKKKLTFTKDYEKITITDQSSNQVKQIKRFGNNSAFGTSNDGKMIVEGGSWGDASIRITEIASGRSWWLEGHPGVVGAIAFSPDGKFLAVGGSDKIIYIFDATERRLVERLIGNNKPIKSVAFSPNGDILISAEDNGDLRVWNWSAGKLLKEVKSEDDIFGIEKVVFSPNGKFFLTKSDRPEFRLWDAITLKVIHTFKTSEKFESSIGSMTLGYDAVPLSAVTFSNDGRNIISSHSDHTVRIWGVESKKQIKRFKVCERATMTTFRRDDKSFLVYCDEGDEHQIRIYDSVVGRQILKFDDEDTVGYIEALSISPNGKYFVTSDIGGTVYLWSMDRSKPIREFDIGFSGDDSIAYSPDGKTFAIGGRNHNLYLFDVETGNKLWQLIPSYQQSELEKSLEAEKDKRQTVLQDIKDDRDKQAAIDTELYKSKVFVTFSHYGDMSDPGEKRMMESDEPKESKVKKTAENSNAVWLRLRNDSPIPIKIPTQSMYLSTGKCFFEFPNGVKVNGLCDNREINIWHGVQDKNGKWIPYGFDFGSSSILLPKMSALFPVPLAILRDGNSIAFDFTFQNIDEKKVSDYGNPRTLKFGRSDLPKPSPR